MKSVNRWVSLPILALSVTGVTGAVSTSASAQSIVPAPDGTGTLVQQRENTHTITGGTQSGGNLFHSFQQFGLNQGQIADFQSAPAIQNILTRVTGGNASLIDGLIRVTGGSSNLYLMNPAGILFGQNARLDVPASLIATTANGIGFGYGVTNGGCQDWFNSVGANEYKNLVGTPDRFAFSMLQPGAIVSAGELAVGQGHPITLVGGVVVNTGTLSAPTGKVTVAAVPGQRIIRLNFTGDLLDLEFPAQIGAPVNPLPFTPLLLPQLLTGGNLDHATRLTVENGVVKLSGVHPVASQPGSVTINNRISTFGSNRSNGLFPIGMTYLVGDRVDSINAGIDGGFYITARQANGSVIRRVTPLSKLQVSLVQIVQEQPEAPVLVFDNAFSAIETLPVDIPQPEAPDGTVTNSIMEDDNAFGKLAERQVDAIDGGIVSPINHRDRAIAADPQSSILDITKPALANSMETKHTQPEYRQFCELNILQRWRSGTNQVLTTNQSEVQLSGNEFQQNPLGNCL
jgi:filamentous hemagglutinin family protein